MLASMLIWRDGNDYLLQLPRSLCEPIRKKLAMYVLRAKVKIENADIVSLGVSGAQAEASLCALFGELPQQAFEVVNGKSSSLIKLGEYRWQLSAAPQRAQEIWAAITAQPVGSPCWDWLNIRAGIPFILPQTQEQFVAQMVNILREWSHEQTKQIFPRSSRTRYLNEYPSQWAAIDSIAPKIGCVPQTLHDYWVKKHEINAGLRDCVHQRGA